MQSETACNDFDKIARHNRPHILSASARSILALILREMSTSYGRSPGGYLWAIAEPVAGTALLAFVFSIAFATPPLGTNFALFYATGLLPFMIYTDISTKVAESIRFSKQLLFYPKVTFIDAILARFILNFTVQIIVSALIFSGIILIFDLHNTLHFPSIFLGIFMAGMLGLGVGTMNCFMTSQYPTWLRLWAIFNRPLFIVSCIFYIPESVSRELREYLLWNPLVHIIGETRSGFYFRYTADYASPLFVFAVSIALYLLGHILLLRYHRDILNKP